MRTVWKYDVPVDDKVWPYDLPEGARPVHVECSDPVEVSVWFEVDTQAKREERRFVVIGTGHPAPDGGTYVDTATVLDGRLVWHLYEVPS